jgi:hypothetical protein
VKLASKLVGWHIEVRAEGQVEDALKRAEGLFAKKPEETPGDVPPPEGVSSEAPPPEGMPSEAPPPEGLPAEASPSVETDVEAKAGPVVEAKEDADADAKETGRPKE